MNKYSFAFFCIILLINISGCSAQSSAVNTKTDTGIRFSKIEISGDEQKNGIFDVSIEYDKNDIGWMAYSRVEIPKFVGTHIAKSKDHGKSWKYVARVNKSEHGRFKYKNKVMKGVWRSETPALLYDPTDIKSRQWKLFSHRYPARSPYKKGNHLYHEGWIEYKVAKQPQGPWSEPIRLFGNRENKCPVNINTLHPSLNNMSFYNEMGVIVVDGIIYMSLDASTTDNGLGDWKKRRIILISSSDHGQSWRYIGDLTNYNDAKALGYLIFTGSSLVAVKDKLFMLMTPSGAKGLFKKNRGHDGTVLVELTDITKAELKRDRQGKLVIEKWFKPSLNSGGLSDYHEKNTAGGILFSQIDTSVKSIKADFFKVFNTGEHITY